MTLGEYYSKLHKIRPTLFVEGEFNGSKSNVALKCIECNNVWNLSHAYEALFNRGNGCPYCNGEIIKKGFNSLGDLRPDLIPFFIDKELPYTLFPYSHKKVELKCPNCGETRLMEVCALTNYGFNCQICGSAVSLPNRVIRSIIINNKNEIDDYSFEYGKTILDGQALDVYFVKNGIKYAIEMQGRQHDKSATKSFYRDTEYDIDYYDELKRQKLKELGVIEIEIECNKTNMEYIKQKILDSKLSDILNLSNID